MAPLIMPSVVLGVALLQFFSVTGLRGNLSALLMAHVVITVALCRALRAGERSPGSILSAEEAARVLGATGVETFRLVTLPADHAGAGRRRACSPSSPRSTMCR
jgi:putative spermidine/putrescine transport system permease protein